MKKEERLGKPKNLAKDRQFLEENLYELAEDQASLNKQKARKFIINYVICLTWGVV
jgi:hypothetical protein